MDVGDKSDPKTIERRLLTPLGLASGLLSRLLFGTEQYAYLVGLTLVGVFAGNLANFGVSLLVFQERPMTVNSFTARCTAFSKPE